MVPLQNLLTLLAFILKTEDLEFSVDIIPEGASCEEASHKIISVVEKQIDLTSSFNPKFSINLMSEEELKRSITEKEEELRALAEKLAEVTNAYSEVKLRG